MRIISDLSHLIIVSGDDEVWCSDKNLGTSEIAQWLRAVATLPDILSKIPSYYMVAHNH